MVRASEIPPVSLVVDVVEYLLDLLAGGVEERDNRPILALEQVPFCLCCGQALFPACPERSFFTALTRSAHCSVPRN
ncbi:hypothetical protein AGR1A_Lc80243 [Agrobacterium fabacearum CFBP 5771]|nr:hypothetical protein AGR1A_Lc80243 [Agrobacterium fabacearum CFBP 5771]